MIDRIVERAVPWGVFIGLGALIGAAFPRETRAAAKQVMVVGFRAADWLQGASAEALEKGQDVFAEARLEYEQVLHEAQRQAERGHLHVVRTPAKKRRATTRGRRRPGRAAATESS